MRYSTRNTLLIVGLLTLFSLGCTINGFSIDTAKVGELQRETETVALNDAESARVQIRMGAGELQIDGGADALMQADFTYNVADWKPQVSYNVDDGQGRLTVRQPNTDQISARGDIRYKWELSFNDDVPMDMRIECGAGDSDIELDTVNVTNLDIKLGAGKAEIDLGGNRSLEDFELDMGAGEVMLDLTGDWEHDVEVNIQGGVGKTTLRLPQNIGVRVKVDKGIGDVDTSGLYRRNNTYVNSAYDDAAITLEVNVQAGIGKVNLEVVE